MARLTTKARKALPESDFAIPSKEPGSGSYPVPDKSHAQNALARVSQFGSSKEKSMVRKKVKAKFPGMMRSKTPNPHMQRENMRTLRQKHGMSEADAVKHSMRMKGGM